MAASLLYCNSHLMVQHSQNMTDTSDTCGSRCKHSKYTAKKCTGLLLYKEKVTYYKQNNLQYQRSSKYS